MPHEPDLCPFSGSKRVARVLSGVFTVLCAVLALACLSCNGGEGTGSASVSSSWTKSLGGSGQEAEVFSANTPDGGFLLAGSTASSDGDISGYLGGAHDVWIARLDGTGALLWSKCFGGSGDDRCSGIVALPDGFALAGDTTSSDGPLVQGSLGTSRRAWAALFDLDGDFVRLNQFVNPSAAAPSDARGGIRATADGGFVLAGTVSDGAYYYGWAVKFNALLEEQWQCRLAANSGFAYADDVAQKADGHYLLCGYTEFGAGTFAGTGYHGGNDGYVFELSEVGAIVRGKCFGGALNDSCTGIVPTPDGGCYVIGHSGSGDGDCPASRGGRDLMLLKLRSDFTLEWARNHGGADDEAGGRGQLAADGSLLFYGSTTSVDGDMTGNHASGSPTSDLLFGKLDSAGNLAWVRCVGGQLDDFATTFLATPEGGYLLGGYGRSEDGDLAGTGHRSGNHDFILFRAAAFPTS